MNRIYRLIAVITIVTFAQGCEFAGAILVIDAAHALGKVAANSSKNTSSESVENSESLAAPVASCDASNKPVAYVDVSGTYISEITETGSRTVFLRKNRKMKITLQQDGNKIIGIGRSKNFEIEGTREGNTIKFIVFAGNQIDGVWVINADATKLEGKWNTDGGGGASGKWNLVRTE